MSLVQMPMDLPVNLNDIADEIRHQYAIAERAVDTLIGTDIAIGRLLAQARHVCNSTQEYGAWFRDQDFGFSQSWGSKLRRLGENASEAHDVARAMVEAGERPTVKSVLRAVCPPESRKDRPQPFVPQPELTQSHSSGYRLDIGTLRARESEIVDAEIVEDHDVHYLYVELRDTLRALRRRGEPMSEIQQAVRTFLA